LQFLIQTNHFPLQFNTHCGPGSSVGIATTGWTVRGSNPGGGARFSASVQTGPSDHTASCTMGIGYFPGVKSGRGVTLTPHPLLVPWSRKGRAISLSPLWALRPVLSLSACTRVHFTLLLFQNYIKFYLCANYSSIYGVDLISCSLYALQLLNYGTNFNKSFF
jgi:hypothetical protein